MSEHNKNNWLKGATGTIVLGIITSFVYDWIKDKPILSTITSIFKSIWEFLVQLMQVELKIWWIVLGLTVYLIGQKGVREYRKSITPELPENLKNYVSASFRNWNWKWGWQWDGRNKKWIVKNLWPYCKKCDIELLDKSDIINKAIECPKCRQRFTNNLDCDDPEGVRTIIYDNIKKNRTISTH